jgi:hypothetical protein
LPDHQRAPETRRCVVAGLAFLIWGIEVKGRSIEEIDAALAPPAAGD